MSGPATNSDGEHGRTGVGMSPPGGRWARSSRKRCRAGN